MFETSEVALLAGAGRGGAMVHFALFFFGCCVVTSQQ
jgi:hypothetical protein